MTGNEVSPELRETRRQIFLALAVVAGIFALLAGGLLLYNQQAMRQVDPLDNPGIMEMKSLHQAAPQDEALKRFLRDYDLHIRQEYADRAVFRRHASYLLAGALALMLLAFHLAGRCREHVPAIITQSPNAQPADTTRSGPVLAIAFLLVALFGVGVIALAPPLEHRRLSSPAAQINADAPPPDREGCPCMEKQPGAQPPTGAQFALPSAAAEIPADYRPERAEWLKNWPCFRGPLQNGVVPDAASSPELLPGKAENLLWRAKVPRKGLNSPIVWNDLVFLSGADSHDTQEVYAFSVTNGKLRWTARIPPAGGSREERTEAGGEAGYAAPTMITDGKRVCAIFATGDVGCVDFSGRLLWSINLGVPENHYGYASSLSYYDGLVIVQWDNRENRKIIALDIASGKTVWQTPRGGEMSWSSPVVLEAETGAQLLTTAAPHVISYNPLTGEEIWRCEVLSGEVTPSATSNGHAFFVTMEHSNLSAIRPGGTGDITKSDLLWQFCDNQPDTSSPLATEDYVITANSAGFLSCVDAKSGELLWDEVFETTFYPSPVLIGENIYLLDNAGFMRVFTPMPKYSLIAEIKLEDEGGPSPAVAGGRMFIRGRGELACYRLTAE